MRKIANSVPYIESYPLSRIGEPRSVLFMDIETTGFAGGSVIYMIGAGCIQGASFVTTQWLAQDPSQERDILEAFLTYATSYDTLVTFNGTGFDAPFITRKCAAYGLNCTLSCMRHADIYKKVLSSKTFLQLSGCKQRDIEAFLGITRIDEYTGGELITVYQDYTRTRDEGAEAMLLQHNHDDVIGMLDILPVLSYCDLLDTDALFVQRVRASSYTDYSGRTKQELIMTISPNISFPKELTALVNGCYLRVCGDECSIRVPIYEEEMKYYYADYKNYYYLPAEDVAIHKSVAAFADRSARVQASAATCYTRQASMYLPQWTGTAVPIFEPFYKRDYKAPDLFFELTEALKQDREAFGRYAEMIVQMMNK